ncbi:M23 family metallopeptidase [Qipengyuania sediminis]|uniref:M23 family metallopeptidase n=1 Tax=Qipengyuania sediminis TaxID=1532023 RepID=UPI00105A7BC2|nr:M23 family metallopeptidase [Qipengyuania sediminis]
MLTFRAKTLRAAMAALIGMVGIAAAPAQAESANLVPHSHAPAAGTGIATEGADRQFQQLFSSWDRTTAERTTIAPSVTVPSRMPLDIFRATSSFGLRTHPVLGGLRGHKGVDLAAPVGTPIYATADGVVSKAEWFGAYGNFIAIAHGAELETRFAHMSRMAVSAGQRVRKGDLIGYVGSTGRSTGPHLHYEVRVAGVAVDPSPFMTETGGQRAYALALGGSK